MKIDITSTYKLNNGLEIPNFGLGVYKSGPGKETINAVLDAFEFGYRLIDTASIYGNEKEVGHAMKRSGLERNEIFVTTKLWNDDHGYENTIKAFNQSLKKLELDYIDLYLIHWPVPGKRKESWKAMEELYSKGFCHSIGVSNYTIQHLKELLAEAEVKPVLNQVEFSPFLNQKELKEFCENAGIKIEAYSPLARMKKRNDHTLLEIANKHSKTTAQILIRWALQQKLIVIPKSSNKKRIKENADVFDFALDENDMRVLNNLDEGYRVSWDPTSII